MNASFAQAMPKPGNIAFISQSGAHCTSILDLARGRNIGFSKFISLGNKADVNEIQLLQYLADDSATDVLLMYLEDISNGSRFIEVARDITSKCKKPMLAIKSGRSKEGAIAVFSHTGSLANSDTAYDAIIFQGGIQPVEGVNEMFHHATAFANMSLPKSNQIAIVTNAGGTGIMATDVSIRYGLKLAAFNEDTTNKLVNRLSATASIHNPVDIMGDADYHKYEAAIRAVLEDDNVRGGV